MSWFDTSGIANIAKTAFKEAQRTIDKALDIKEDDSYTVPENTPIDTNSDDFFSAWNIASANSSTKGKDAGKGTKTSASLWGSFTGSFFESSAKEQLAKPQDSVDSLDDSTDIGVEQFSDSKLVVQTTEDEIVCKEEDESKSLSSDEQNVSVRKREKSIGSGNRLSEISLDSGGKSSESVEIVTGSECTTSPESEAISAISSISSSKQTSESVEILPNSLTSPSSVEILDYSSRRQSQYSDEFISPSPQQNTYVSEKFTPDSVEVIPEDLDDNSIADDTMSYNSVSENTAATVLENFNIHIKPKGFAILKADSASMNESISSDLSLSPEKTNLSDIPITRAPSRGGMHLPLQVNLIDTQPQSSKQDLTTSIQNINVIDIPQDNEAVGSTVSEIDDGTQSDKTLILSDNIMESSSDTSTTTDSNTNSLYLKNMLADAMSEKIEGKTSHFMDLSQSMIDSTAKLDNMQTVENISIMQLDMPPRETSPISSESRSDLVKIGSDHTSGHTSGDELETTTSSDIEIISSPNGDSSSTHSRHSPAKAMICKGKGEPHIDSLLGKMAIKKIKGHNRELSAASSVSDDTEIDKLLKRLSEMTEILESRESKLIEVSRKNVEIQEVNNDLRKQIDAILNKQVNSADLSQVTEEYTQRLSALERKFQQAIREKDLLRKQLEQCKMENSQRLSKGEIESVMEEKDQIIKELREEGEKLSKQQLQHSNIIKKLRAKEKDQESAIKHLRESVEDLTSETDRLKRSLSAKEDVERSQIDAVHQLTSKNKKMEQEKNQLQGNLDDITQKYDTAKKSLDAAKKELIEQTRTSSELQHREQMMHTLENEKKMTESQNEEILNQLEDLRYKLRTAENENIAKEQKMRSENTELLRRLEDAETRNEELSQSVLEVSKPLVRQLETLQATHNMKLSNFEKVEQSYTLKINELQSKLQGSLDIERVTKEECHTVKAKLLALENEIASYVNANEKLKMQLDQESTNKMIMQQEMNKEINTLKEKISDEYSTIENLHKEIEVLQQKLLIEKTNNEVDRKKISALQEHVNQKPDIATRTSPPNVGNISPTLSLGRVSLSESINSTLWAPDDSFEMSAMPRCTNMLEMQVLQTNLKQRDGEVQQLQWELNRREHERSLLNTEISNLLSKVEELENKCSNHESIQKELIDIQQKYETLCQLYGEKVEETEELKLDLQDVKEMFKAQIDELLKQQRNSE